jgi:tetratricopeptide (TPR) repeat protein
MTAMSLALYPSFESPERRRLQSLMLDAQNARNSGDYPKAEQIYSTLIQEARGRPDFAADLHSARSGLASVYKAHTRYAEAESIYLSLLTEAKESPPSNTLLHAAYLNLAELYQDTGRYSEAEQYYRRTLAEAEKPELWPNFRPLVSTLIRVAQFYVSRKTYAAAEPLFKRAIQILEQEEPRRDFSLPHYLREFARFYQDQGNHREAENLYRRALVVSEQCRGPEDAATIHYLYDLAAFYCATGRHDEAESLYRRALATVEKTAALATARYLTPWKRLTLKPSTLEGVIRNIESSVGTALDHLAECCEDQQRYSEAEPLRRRSLEIMERGWGKIVPYRLADALETYAAVLRKLGRAGEAEHVESRARPIRAKYPKGSYRCQLQLSTRPMISLRARFRTFMSAILHSSNV